MGRKNPNVPNFEPKLTRTVSILALHRIEAAKNRLGQLSVQNKGDHKQGRPDFAGKYPGVGFAGGGIESGESMLHAVDREGHHETGYPIEHIVAELEAIAKRPFMTRGEMGIPDKNVFHAHLCEANPYWVDDIKERDEIEWAKWITLQDWFRNAHERNFASWKNGKGFYHSHAYLLEKYFTLFFRMDAEGVVRFEAALRSRGLYVDRFTEWHAKMRPQIVTEYRLLEEEGLLPLPPRCAPGLLIEEMMTVQSAAASA